MYDHYEQAKQIAVELGKAGHDSVSQSLMEDLQGFSSLEILLAIRHHLEGFISLEPELSVSLRSQIRDLIRHIIQSTT